MLEASGTGNPNWGGEEVAFGDAQNLSSEARLKPADGNGKILL